MRRAMLLALVALALPMAVSANTVSFNSGTFDKGTIQGNLAEHFSLEVVGSRNTLLLKLTLPGGCSTVCRFTGGTLEVTPNGSGTPIFMDAISSGILIHSRIGPPHNLINTAISASLATNDLIESGILAITATTT